MSEGKGLGQEAPQLVHIDCGCVSCVELGTNAEECRTWRMEVDEKEQRLMRVNGAQRVTRRWNEQDDMVEASMISWIRFEGEGRDDGVK
jgi:hypothetical protein